jgi:hypothetical protein
LAEYRNPMTIIPKGAVIASIESCDPKLGWSALLEGTGRFLVGAGDKYAPGYENWYRDLGDDKTQVIALNKTAFTSMHPGGEVDHQLTIREIPTHDHPVESHLLGDYQRGGGGVFKGIEFVGREDPKNDPKWQPVRYTEAVGGGQPHKIMPPFIALFYCKKD